MSVERETFVLNKIIREKQFKVSVGGIIIEYAADESLLLKIVESQYSFIVNNGKPDLSIKVHYGKLPYLRLEEKIFDARESGGVWALYRSQNNFKLTLTSPRFGPVPYRVAVFDSDFTHGELYIRPLDLSGGQDSMVDQGADELPCYDPTEYPLDEVLFVMLLSRGRGVDLHACGIDLAGKGILFSGVSGAGKSTIAELWKKKKVNLLSDDRIIVRRINGRLQMFGTPWHGDARASLPENVPLKAIYFLEQSKENKALPLDIADSAFRLMVRCFPTYYSKQGMEYTLDFITELAQEIPCYELQFTPDERAIDTVLSHVESFTS